VRGALRVAAALAACALLACSTGATYAQFAASTPKPPEGQGRIIVYLTDVSEAPAFWPIMTVDGQVLGELRTGTFFYVDRPAGVHQIGVGVKKSLGAFGNQGATDPVFIGVGPGTTSYLQVFVTAPPGMVMVQLQAEDAANGMRDLSSLHYVPPTPPP